MGIHTRTGAAWVVRAKATILAPASREDLVVLDGVRPAFRDPNLTGDGVAVAWNAGAEFARLEESFLDSGALAYIPYGVATPTTLARSPIVDAGGKRCPGLTGTARSCGLRWNGSGRRRDSASCWATGSGSPHLREPRQGIGPRLPERLAKGEFVLPSMPTSPLPDRNAEPSSPDGGERGKTRIPVYDA